MPGSVRSAVACTQATFRPVDSTASAVLFCGWLSSRRERLSDKAYHGFLARYFVPMAIRREPFTAFRLLAAAVASDSISMKRASYLAMRGAMPGLYGRLRDLLVSRRASDTGPPL